CVCDLPGPQYLASSVRVCASRSHEPDEQKLSKNERITGFISFKLFAIELKVLFNVILHVSTVSTCTN
ncbi:MAG: hypothetical protein O6945_07850, partial [Gammaproteobacteria bacterium]|nr:hypothetical protein [Gammaproteobacteria bacterium]